MYLNTTQQNIEKAHIQQILSGYYNLNFVRAIMEISQNVQAPIGLATNAVLAAMSATLDGTINVRPPYLQNDTNRANPVSLYLVAIANSGDRKSEVERHAMQGIRNFEQAQQATYKLATEEYEAKQEAWDLEKKRLLKASLKDSTIDVGSRLIELNQRKPHRPKEYKKVFVDVTIEGLLTSMRDNDSVALISSEASSILSGRAMADTSKFNDLWSGTPIRVERKTTDSLELSNKRLTISAMLQPERMEHFLTTRGTEARGAGFLARALIIKPTSIVGSRFEPYSITWVNRDLFNQKVEQLLAFNKQHFSQPNAKPLVMEFSKEATQRFKEISSLIETQSQYGYYQHATDHASKLADNISRVAALIQFFEDGTTIITYNTLELAIRLCYNLYSPQFISIFSPQSDTSSSGLWAWLWGKFIAQQMNLQPMVIRKTEIMKNGPATTRKKSRLDPALQQLMLSQLIYQYIGADRKEYIRPVMLQDGISIAPQIILPMQYIQTPLQGLYPQSASLIQH